MRTRRWRSGSFSRASASQPISISPMTVPATSEARSSSMSSPISVASASGLRGWLRLEASHSEPFRSRTSSIDQPSRPATSSSAGSRSISEESSLYARAIFRILSPMCTGTLMVRPLSATARCTACLTHQVAYVENLQPRSGSNFSTAFIRPMLPSWMRSSKGSPIPRYFLATLTTSLRFFSMSLWRAPLSPDLALLERSISSACVSSLPLSMWAKYPGMRSGVSEGRPGSRVVEVLLFIIVLAGMSTSLSLWISMACSLVFVTIVLYTIYYTIIKYIQQKVVICQEGRIEDGREEELQPVLYGGQGARCGWGALDAALGARALDGTQAVQGSSGGAAWHRNQPPREQAQ